MSHRHCRDFSRGQLLRRAAAEAGRGLPAIEPGMPLPAGTGLTRRSMLVRSAGLALSIYGASKLGLGALEAGVAEAAAPGQPVLVSVFLEGGVDSMSVLAPVGDPNYRRLRPKLALPESAGMPFGEDGRLRWHPSAAGLATLHGEGKVSVLPAVGYDRPDQSHFNSRHFWEVGAVDVRGRTGWMGRYLDRVGTPGNPLQGLSLDGRLSPTLATSQVPVAAVEGPDDYTFWARDVWGRVEDLMHEAFADVGAGQSSGDPALSRAGAAAVQAGRLRQQLSDFSGKDGKPAFTSPVSYPDGGREQFPEQLAALVAMLAAGLPLRCVALSAPGDFDTHDEQPQALADNLKLTSDSLLAFQRDLEARGLAGRVVTLAWSEFGRRAEENGSNGTDHGAAGLGLLLGSRVRGRMIGEFPGLKGGLDGAGNLRATTDFRSLYSGLLEQWLGTDASGIVPDAGRFGRPALIA